MGGEANPQRRAENTSRSCSATVLHGLMPDGRPEDESCADGSLESAMASGKWALNRTLRSSYASKSSYAHRPQRMAYTVHATLTVTDSWRLRTRWSLPLRMELGSGEGAKPSRAEPSASSPTPSTVFRLYQDPKYTLSSTFRARNPKPIAARAGGHDDGFTVYTSRSDLRVSDHVHEAERRSRSSGGTATLCGHATRRPRRGCCAAPCCAFVCCCRVIYLACHSSAAKCYLGRFQLRECCTC